MSSIGQIEPYCSSDDLDEYLERLDQSFVANDIGSLAAGVDDNEVNRRATERKRVATFLTLIGSETYKLLKSLVSPTVPSTKTFVELTDILKSHLKPKKLIVAERYRFHKRHQSGGESVASFEAGLRSLAATCEFGQFLSEALTDQFVCGICSESTQRKLLSQDRTFEQALQTAIADEIAEAETKAIHSHVSGYANPMVVQAVVDKSYTRGCDNYNMPAVVDKNYTRGRANYNRHAVVSGNQRKHGHAIKTCYRCNGDHAGQECRFRDAVCHECKRTGHIARACRKKGTSANVVDSARTPAVEHQSIAHSLFTLSAQNDAVAVTLDMNGTPIKLIVDTGAGVSLISERTFRADWKRGQPLLEPANDVTLKSYTGQSLVVIGQFEPDIEYNGQTAMVPILVVQGDRPNLLGRNILGFIKKWTGPTYSRLITLKLQHS